MNYKEFKIGKLEIYLSSTIRNKAFDFEILPRLAYQKDTTYIYEAQRSCITTRTVVMSWLIFYVSISIHF